MLLCSQTILRTAAGQRSLVHSTVVKLASWPCVRLDSTYPLSNPLLDVIFSGDVLVYITAHCDTINSPSSTLRSQGGHWYMVFTISFCPCVLVAKQH